MYSLRNAGHIKYSSPIELTQKGKTRIENNIINYGNLPELITNAIIELDGLDNNMIFRWIYNTITT